MKVKYRYIKKRKDKLFGNLMTLNIMKCIS